MPAVRLEMFFKDFEQHKQAELLKRRKHSRLLAESILKEVTASSKKELVVPA